MPPLKFLRHYAQAGARKVIAVEASGMARYCNMLRDANPGASMNLACSSGIHTFGAGQVCMSPGRDLRSIQSLIWRHKLATRLHSENGLLWAWKQSMSVHAELAVCLCTELSGRIEVVQAKVEDLDLKGERVDVLISEPMGTLLVNERMLETYLHARDHFLAPGGRMFPVRERLSICVHPTHAWRLQPAAFGLPRHADWRQSRHVINEHPLDSTCYSIFIMGCDGVALPGHNCPWAGQILLNMFSEAMAALTPASCCPCSKWGASTARRSWTTCCSRRWPTRPPSGSSAPTLAST